MGKHKKVAELIETNCWRFGSTYSAMAALIWLRKNGVKKMVSGTI